MTTLPDGIHDFLGAAGWAGAQIAPLTGDASFRRYFRVHHEGRSAMLMHAPPPEEPRVFLHVGRWLIDEAGAGTEIKVFVDTAPVMEKPLAQAAGLGWQGKHTNLLSRDLGSWFFLGAIFTTAELEPDRPGRENCGRCTACLDVCPTDAFPAPFQLDARRCISYLTIEHKGPVDEALRPLLGNRIYGCDDCLAVCPWNKFAAEASEARYLARDDFAAPRLADLAALDDAAFREKFSGSPIKRIGRNRFLRNVAYAMGNSGDPSFAPQLRRLAGEPDPVLADAARGALGRIAR